MSELDSRKDGATAERLRREGAAWRARRRECPPPDLVMLHGSEALPEDVRARLAQHLEACEACRRLARDFDEAERGSEDEAERRVFARVSRGTRWVPSRGLMLAAGVLLGCGLVATWWVRLGTTLDHATGTRPSSSGQAADATARPASSLQAALWTIAPVPVRIPLSSLGATRGAEGAAAARGRALLAALEPYQAGEYSAAAARLEVFTRQYPAAPDGFLYLGVAYLMAGRPADALAPLDRAAELKPEADEREVNWYRAAAEQRAGRLPDAKVRLRALCQAPGAYQTDACAAEATLR